jgi:hypothetical protein
LPEVSKKSLYFNWLIRANPSNFHFSAVLGGAACGLSRRSASDFRSWPLQVLRR